MKKLIFMVAALAITSTGLFAQTSSSNSSGGGTTVTTYSSGLQAAYGGTGNDGGDFTSIYYSDMKVISGGYILGGMSNSNAGGSKSVSTFGSNDYYVVKTDFSGTVIWDKTYGGTASDLLGQIFPTSDGGYLLAGTSSSGISGNKTTAAFGSTDAWIVKIDALGNIVWQTSYGGTGNENTTKNIFEVNGNYYVGVSSGSGVSGNKTLPSFGLIDFGIIGLNAQTGNIVFEKSYGGSLDDDLHSIYVKGDGSFVLFGNSKSGATGVKTSANMGNWDYWVISCSANGSILWQNSFGGAGYDFVTDARAVRRSNGTTMFVVGGISNSGVNTAGMKTENTHGAFDIWLVALQDNGTKLWDHTYGGTSNDLLETIDLQNNTPLFAFQTIYDEVIILSGYSNSNAFASTNGYKTDNNFGPSDGWVILATAATGQEYKDFTIGGTGDDAAVTTKPVLTNILTADYDYVTLSFTASGISGNKTVASLGGYDMWLNVMEKRTYTIPGPGFGFREGAATENNSGNEISKSIYPTFLKNGDEINVLFDAPQMTDSVGTLQAVIYNLEGKAIFKEALFYGQKQIIRPEFPCDGIYILCIMNGDDNLLCSKKIVVQ